MLGRVKRLWRGWRAQLRLWGRRVLHQIEFRAALFLGRVVILADPGGRPSPAFARSRHVPPKGPKRAPPFTDATHPVSRRLRDIAVVDLFRWLGVETPPPQIWGIVERWPDPQEAVSTFLRSLGIDVDAVRRRDREALSRLHNCLDAMHAWAATAAAKDATVTQRFQFSVLSADSRDLARLAHNLEILAGIAGRYEAVFVGGKPFRGYSDFVREISRYITDPLAVSDDDVRNAEALADRFESAALEHSRLGPNLHRDVADLLSNWHDLSPTPDEELLFSGISRAIEEAEYDLFVVGRTPAWDLIRSFRDLQAELTRLRAEMFARRADPGDPAGGARGPDAEPVDESKTIAGCCKLFGIDPTSPPTADELKRLWRSLAGRAHPDRFTTDAEKGEATRKFQVLQNAYEILRMHWGFPR